MRVLLIEDEPWDAARVGDVLAKGPTGRTLERVERLAEGILRLREPPEVDVVLLDLGLPDSQGFDTLVGLREGLPTAYRTPAIVVLTGSDEDDLGKQLIRAHVEEFLPKGDLSVPLLSRILEHAVERRNMRQQRDRMLIQLQEHKQEIAQALEETRHAQAQLEVSRRLEVVGTLAAGVAHELNTPLQYISNNAEFVAECGSRISELTAGLLEVVESGAPAAEQVAAITRLVRRAKLAFVDRQLPAAGRDLQEGVQRAQAIVDSLRDFGSPDAAQLGEVCVRQCVSNTLGLLKPQLERVALQYSPGSVSALATACRTEVSQALLAVLHNAIEATRRAGQPGASIAVHVSDNEHAVTVRISNNGPPIAPDTARRMFDPFFTTKAPGNGTGQGLTVARAVVRSRGGDLVHRQTEDGWTQFVLTFPRTDAKGTGTEVA